MCTISLRQPRRLPFVLSTLVKALDPLALVLQEMLVRWVTPRLLLCGSRYWLRHLLLRRSDVRTACEGVRVEVVVGLVIAWVIAKARRVAVRADGVVDQALDTAVDRVGDLVTTRLAGDSALAQLEAEAADKGEVLDRTRQRVQLAVEDAVEKSPEFGRELETAVAAAHAAGAAAAQSTGSHGVVINGSVIGSGSGVVIGAVTGGVGVGTPPDPQLPARG